MTALVVVLLLAGTPKKDEPRVIVDSVTVNGEKTGGSSSGTASATHSGQDWSVVTAKPVGTGGKKLEAGLGFPGVYGQLLYGLTDAFDVGGRLSLNYGWEGQVDRIWPGFKLQGVAKFKLLDNGKLNFGLAVSPGIMLYWPQFPYGASRNPLVAFALPVEATLGIVASSALNVGVKFEMPLWILFGTSGGLIVPILMGVGVEYFFSSAMCFWGDIRMGPSIWTQGGTVWGPRSAVFTFDAKVGVGWRF